MLLILFFIFTQWLRLRKPGNSAGVLPSGDKCDKCDKSCPWFDKVYLRPPHVDTLLYLGQDLSHLSHLSQFLPFSLYRIYSIFYSFPVKKIMIMIIIIIKNLRILLTTRIWVVIAEKGRKGRNLALDLTKYTLDPLV